MHLQWILTSLVLLRVGIINGREATSNPRCTVRAWVRAPDLIPITIVQGDARVKISADCPTVDTIKLGLRFKERSFMKTLRSRDDATLLDIDPLKLDYVRSSLWASLFINQTYQEAYDEVLTIKDLWIIREEERAVFETTQPFYIGMKNGGILRDAVQDFAILVPSTNFPPALEKLVHGVPTNSEILDVEWIYEYFVQISFSNGTTKDVSAGYTAFQPLHDPADTVQGPRSMNIELTTDVMGRKHARNAPGAANYSIEISADSALSFFTGTKDQVVKAIISRTGFARTFSAPLKVIICVVPILSPKWAVEYKIVDLRTEFPRMPTSMFRDDQVASDRRRHLSSHPFMVNIMMPNSSADEIEAKEIVTTTSAEFIISIELEDTHVADFETYYQILANSLSITLQSPSSPDLWSENVDPDDPLGGPKPGNLRLQFEDDEEDWVPWENPLHAPPVTSYWGSAPVVVYPADEVTLPRRCLAVGTVTYNQVVLSDDATCERRSLTHYLDEGARGPVFVGYSSGAVAALLAEDPAVRELRAPSLEPVVSSLPEGEELVYRYYTINLGRPPIYVGETWAKKVANKDGVY